MTDSRLQELKRAWEASQSVEDEAAYLRERVRVGDLTQERLELAAYCGHPGAKHSLEEEVLDNWEGGGLSRFVQEVGERCLGASVVAMLELVRIDVGDRYHSSGLEALEVANETLQRPAPEILERCAQLADAMRARASLLEAEHVPNCVWCVCRAAYFVAAGRGKKSWETSEAIVRELPLWQVRNLQLVGALPLADHVTESIGLQVAFWVLNTPKKP